MKKVYYFDMDGVLCNFHKEKYNPYNAGNRKWIASLEPFTENVNLVKRLIAEGNSVYINSLARNEEAVKGKLDWLARYLPEIDRKHIIINTTSTNNKDQYMKTKTGILVDDKLANCKRWTKESGQPAIWLEVRGAEVKI